MHRTCFVLADASGASTGVRRRALAAKASYVEKVGYTY
jgi:hypothetical protein